MLTGDLLLFRFTGGRFKIRFVDKNEPDLLLLAQSLIDCFADAAHKGLARNQLEEALELFRHQNELKVVDGLIKTNARPHCHSPMPSAGINSRNTAADSTGISNSQWP